MEMFHVGHCNTLIVVNILLLLMMLMMRGQCDARYMRRQPVVADFQTGGTRTA